MNLPVPTLPAVRTINACADILSSPIRFDRSGYAYGGKIHAVTSPAPNADRRTISTACGRSGLSGSSWAPESWANLVRDGAACARCISKIGAQP